MQRSLGRSCRNTLRRSERRAPMGVERLENRLALSSAPVAWVELVRELAARLPDNAPVHVAMAPATVDAPLVARFTSQTSQSASSLPQPVVIQWPRAAATEIVASSPIQSGGHESLDFEQFAFRTEMVSGGSDTATQRFTEIRHISDLDAVFHNAPIFVAIDHLPIGEHSIFDLAKDISAQHDAGVPGQQDPSDVNAGTPTIGSGGKQGGTISFSPGLSNRPPTPTFVPAVDTAVPKDSTAVASTVRATQGDASGVVAAAGSAGPLQSSPFATALGGFAGASTSPVRWLLPYLGLPSQDDLRLERRAAGDSNATHDNDGLARNVPQLANAALAIIADSPAALGALAGGVGQPTSLLGNVALNTEALDQALASVLDEVEQLGGDLYCWFDEAKLAPWAGAAAALAIAGVGGAAWRWRAKRDEDEQSEHESSTWLFHQLQSSGGI